MVRDSVMDLCTRLSSPHPIYNFTIISDGRRTTGAPSFCRRSPGGDVYGLDVTVRRGRVIEAISICVWTPPQMYFGWRSGRLKLLALTDGLLYSLISLFGSAEVLLTLAGGETDGNWILSLYKVVIEYHICFAIHTGVSAASISRALSDFISFTRDDLYCWASLLSAKSASESLGTLRTFELITPSSLRRPSRIMIFLGRAKRLLLPLKVENAARRRGGQTFSLLLS